MVKEQGLSADQRLPFHQAHSGPVVARLKEWLQTQSQERKVEPNSSLGKAIAYMLKHWEPLTLFLRVPGAPLDSLTNCPGRGKTAQPFSSPRKSIL